MPSPFGEGGGVGPWRRHPNTLATNQTTNDEDDGDRNPAAGGGGNLQQTAGHKGARFGLLPGGEYVVECGLAEAVLLQTLFVVCVNV